MFKRCNVVMLPTNEKASIFIDTIEPGVLIFDKNYVGSNIHWKDVPHYHLYIISDDKIEESDWWLNKEANYNNIINDRSLAKLANNAPSCKKIIASTDNSLRINSSIRDTSNDNYGKLLSIIARPSDSFISKYIEEYNKGNIITDVMVEYEQKRVYGDELDIHGHNKEVVKVNSKDNTITIKKVKDSWSREEVINLLKKVKCDFPYHRGIQVLDNMLDNWIKENL